MPIKNYLNNQSGIASIILGFIVVVVILAGAGVALFKDKLPFIKSNTPANIADVEKKVELEKITIGLYGGLGIGVNTAFYPFVEPDMPGYYVQAQYMEPLVIMDNKQKVQPALAESWSNIDDNTWRFNLRRNIKFSDGSPFTAEDVKFTFDMILNNAEAWAENENLGAGNERFLESIKEVKVINPDTVDIITTKIDRGLLYKLSRLFILSHINFKPTEFEKVPIGTGPYILKEGERDSYVVFERNSNYWGQKPYVKTVTYKVVEDENQRVDDLLSGKLDVIEFVPASRSTELKNNPVIKVKSMLDMAVSFIALDINRDKSPYITGVNTNPFKDIRVRKAMQHAINIDEIVKNSFDDMAEPQSQLANRNVIGYNPNIQRLPYDLQKAKDLMKEAGYEKGFKVNLDVRHKMIGNYVSEAAEQLKEIGINVNVRVRRADTTGAADRKKLDEQGDTSMFGNVWTFEDGESLLTLTQLLHTFDKGKTYGGDNFTRYTNTDADSLIEKAAKETNVNKRIEYMQQAMKLTMDDYAFIPLTTEIVTFATRNNIDWTPRFDLGLFAFEMAGTSE